jgi:uroporphyrinogen decarboxylase
MIDLPWKPDPDYHRLLNTLRRQGDSERVVWMELFADPEIMGSILEEPPSPTKDKIKDRETLNQWLDQRIRFWYQLGYDAFWLGPNLTWPSLHLLETGDPAVLSRGKRTWVNEKAGRITNWKEFERFPWPSFADVDFYPLEYTARHLPQGMAIIAQNSGILEPAMWLMGYETFAMAIYSQPDLVEAIFTRLSEIYLPLARALVEADRVVALWMGDDMGYKTSTMISPKHLRKYVFPIQKQIAEIAHAKGLPFILHSCGKLDLIMQDLIVDVGIDAKHSFEDAIEPVERFCDRFGKQIAVIGGVDVDLLARGTEAQVRERTRHILEACVASHGYILGSGNSIANYVQPRNFLAMLDEGYRYNTARKIT